MMSSSPDSGTLTLMQDRLAGTENDTKELAKMLLDLGISPSIENDDQFRLLSPEYTAYQDSLENEQPKEKSVRFGPVQVDSTMKSSQRQPILKKNTIKPLKVNLNSLNKADSAANITSHQYSALVKRLCKTESIIQSLKLSMCAIQTTHESAEREKNIVIDKLKEEISEYELKKKRQDDEMVEARRKIDEHRRRWEEAEMEVKNLHERLQEHATKSKESSTEEEILRGKFSRRIEEAKQEAAREKEVRVAIEDSHLSLLSRVQDMEDTIQHERTNVESLNEENTKLKQTNDNLKRETSNFHLKAKDLEQTLTGLKEELDAKEKAIRRLIEEQHRSEVDSSSLANQQASLHKELKQCNIVLDVQKSAFANLEAENIKLRKELNEMRINLDENEQEDRKKEEEDMIRRNEELLNREECEDKIKAEMNQLIKNEKKRCKEIEERCKLLEQCIKEQERVMKEKEQEQSGREKEQDEKIFEERKKVSRITKEKEEATRAKENLMKDLNRATSDVARDKEFLQQQVEELKLEQEVSVKERQQMEEENQRLLNRVACVEQQEQAYKRAQDLAHQSNAAKSQLAYENGKLQTRVEQLEEELRSVASVQSQVVQLRASNRALEQKYSQLTSELATSRVDFQRTNAHIKQLQSGLLRKEEDFNLAIAARDEAVQDKDAALAHVDVIKEQEKNKVVLIKRDLVDCRSDNERLTSTINDVASRHAQLQDAFNQVQGQLGRKDTQLSQLIDERNRQQHELNELHTMVANLQSTLQERDDVEQNRISPALDALERARHENDRLTNSLEEVLCKNEQLKNDLDKCKTDLEIQHERVDVLSRQQEANEKDLIVTSQTHADRLQQMKDQFSRERTTMKKQMQSQMVELKKSVESSQSRNSQLARGNTELRSKLADREQALAKLKEKLKQQKMMIDRQQRDRRHHVETEQKIKAIDTDLLELEKTKTNYMEKNKQQYEIISSFNQEVESLKDDIAALSHAQKLARETTLKLEAEVNKERSDKQVLKDKIQMMEHAVKRAINEKQDAQEKLRKVEVESIQVQENLQEAQTWFKDKFERLQNELTTKK